MDTLDLLKPNLDGYLLDHAYDEMFASPGVLRPQYQVLMDQFCALPKTEVERRKQAADLSFLNQGITFTVYGRDEGTEKIVPYDMLPRMITAAEWATVEKGLTQRITALNLFLKDIYNEGRILADGIVPRELVYSCKQFRRHMIGLQVPRNVYIAVTGTDQIRLENGEFVVESQPCSRALAHIGRLSQTLCTPFRHYIPSQRQKCEVKPWHTECYLKRRPHQPQIVERCFRLIDAVHHSTPLSLSATKRPLRQHGHSISAVYIWKRKIGTAI